MSTGISLASVATAVKNWRQKKQHKTALLPESIAAHIRELAKHHKKSHIAEALKMSGSTVNKALQGNTKLILASNKTLKQPRNVYSTEEKRALCQEWKDSGIGIEKFSQAKKVSKSALYQWSRDYLKKEERKPDWFEVKPLEPCESSLNNIIWVDLALPNQMTARVKVLKTEIITFLKELSHAIAIVR